MSAVAVVGVAAICAGAVCLGRVRAGREARKRCDLRRRGQSGLRRSRSLRPTGDGQQRLESAIERAVFAADLTCCYRRRLEQSTRRTESPFQFRRSLMDASFQRYSRAIVRLELVARGWLEHTGNQRREPTRAITELLDVLHQGGPDPHGLDQAIDALETALTSLRTPRTFVGELHPFR